MALIKRELRARRRRNRYLPKQFGEHGQVDDRPKGPSVLVFRILVVVELALGHDGCTRYKARHIEGAHFTDILSDKEPKTLHWLEIEACIKIIQDGPVQADADSGIDLSEQTTVVIQKGPAPGAKALQFLITIFVGEQNIIRRKIKRGHQDKIDG